MTDDVEIVEADSLADPAKRARRIKTDVSEAVRWWKQAMSAPAGRGEIWKLLTDAHTFETRFACSPTGFPQPEATWFEAGKQAWGQALYHRLLRMAREETSLMLDENDPAFAKPKQRKAKTDE